MIEYKNTPATAFQSIADYPFQSFFKTIEDGMQVHYIDEGQKGAEVILMMHGEPSWSYLYRHMIPTLVDMGYRCIAPDLIGFGKSSKPVHQADYTYARHVDWMLDWLDQIDVSDITLFCQDWGGLIGLRLVGDRSDRFARIITSNTGLPTGDYTPPEAFIKWQKFSQTVDKFPFEKVMQGATTSELSEATLAAYRAPFPDESYTAGAKIFPSLVPTRPDDPASQKNRDVWSNVLKQWNKPLLTLFGDKDPVTKGGEKVFHKLVPGATGQSHHTVVDGGHFIQEDKPAELVKHIHQFILSNPLT